jgi:hypothetical protein
LHWTFQIRDAFPQFQTISMDSDERDEQLGLTDEANAPVTIEHAAGRNGSRARPAPSKQCG